MKKQTTPEGSKSPKRSAASPASPQHRPAGDHQQKRIPGLPQEANATHHRGDALQESTAVGRQEHRTDSQENNQRFEDMNSQKTDYRPLTDSGPE